MAHLNKLLFRNQDDRLITWDEQGSRISGVFPSARRWGVYWALQAWREKKEEIGLIGSCDRKLH